MRLVFALVLAALVLLLPVSFGGGKVGAGIVCGTFDGRFTCRRDNTAAPQFGKNASPGGTPTKDQADLPGQPAPLQEAPPAGWMTEGAAGGTPDPTACQHGMVGTPPDCKCPKNSELLGGNCVHYTASACSSGLASDAMPQGCRSAEEKVSCSMRQDGLKDCCCVTYDKF